MKLNHNASPWFGEIVRAELVKKVDTHDDYAIARILTGSLLERKAQIPLRKNRAKNLFSQDDLIIRLEGKSTHKGLEDHVTGFLISSHAGNFSHAYSRDVNLVETYSWNMEKGFPGRKQIANNFNPGFLGKIVLFIAYNESVIPFEVYGSNPPKIWRVGDENSKPRSPENAIAKFNKQSDVRNPDSARLLIADKYVDPTILMGGISKAKKQYLRIMAQL